MTLPADFQFSQGSLQDYADCPRRFQLRYILRLAWPAVEAEPVLESERRQLQGQAFHRLVHQHLLGIPSDRLAHMAADEDLRRWWHHYLEDGPADLPPARYPEIRLTGSVAGHQLMARYDLIAADAGQRLVIVDWKTSRQRSSRRWLAGRLQTQVYPYLAVRAGSHLNEGQPVQPEQVAMVYWFSEFPADPERFPYDGAQYQADEARLTALIEEIKTRDDEVFPLTTDERQCQYCRYRSLCERGVEAGPIEGAEAVSEWGDGFDVSIDFEQIAEIGY